MAAAENTTELIIDVDTHVTEPADTWVSRVPPKYRDDVPHVVFEEKAQREAWHLQGKRIGLVGLSAVAGWDRGPFPSCPSGYAEAHPASYDAKARLDYMDSLGVWAQVIYPNVGGFGSQNFIDMDDEGLKLACVEAYNDFQTEWASADPRRILPISATPFWDVDATVREVRRCHGMGHRGVLFTGEPQIHGQPFLGDAHWDPLWETAQELEMPISFHVGSGDFGSAFAKDRVAAHGMAATYANSTIGLLLGNGAQVGDLLLSGVLPRFPDLKFVSVESGIGWVPFVLEAADYAFKDGQVAVETPIYGDLLPSDLFNRQVYACYWFEQMAPNHLFGLMSTDNIMFETDFPHPTCLYGDDVWKRIHGALDDQPSDVRRNVLWNNAQKLYKVEDPTDADRERIAGVVGATR